jgi:hypothetical protein
LVVGYGFGTTANVLKDAGLDVLVVELEPEVLSAASAVGAGPPDAVEVAIADARAWLLWHPVKYDVIVSQPSHPWRAGMANLYSEEWFSLVRERLSDPGICCQWINLFCIDRRTLESVVATFYSVFEGGLVYTDKDEMACALIGTKGGGSRSLEWRDEYAGIWRQLGIGGIEDIQRLCVGSREDCLAGIEEAALMTDLNILIEVSGTGARYVGRGSEDPLNYVEAVRKRRGERGWAAEKSYRDPRVEEGGSSRVR